MGGLEQNFRKQCNINLFLFLNLVCDNATFCTLQQMFISTLCWFENREFHSKANKNRVLKQFIVIVHTVHWRKQRKISILILPRSIKYQPYREFHDLCYYRVLSECECTLYLKTITIVHIFSRIDHLKLNYEQKMKSFLSLVSFLCVAVISSAIVPIEEPPIAVDPPPLIIDPPPIIVDPPPPGEPCK